MPVREDAAGGRHHALHARSRPAGYPSRCLDPMGVWQSPELRAAGGRAGGTPGVTSCPRTTRCAPRPLANDPGAPGRAGHRRCGEIRPRHATVVRSYCTTNPKGLLTTSRRPACATSRPRPVLRGSAFQIVCEVSASRTRTRRPFCGSFARLRQLGGRPQGTTRRSTGREQGSWPRTASWSIVGTSARARNCRGSRIPDPATSPIGAHPVHPRYKVALVRKHLLSCLYIGGKRRDSYSGARSENVLQRRRRLQKCAIFV